MKKTLKLVIALTLAFGMLACGGNENKDSQSEKVEQNDQKEQKEITLESLKKVEASLANERGALNKEAAQAAVEQYCKFVEQKPDDKTAPEWLFKAMQIEMSLGESDKAINLTDKLVKDYPEYENVPVALFMLATNVYDAQLHDLGKAHATFERVIKDYPDTQWASDAKVMIGMLGMTEDEMLEKIRPQAEGEEIGE